MDAGPRPAPGEIRLFGVSLRDPPPRGEEKSAPTAASLPLTASGDGSFGPMRVPRSLPDLAPFTRAHASSLPEVAAPPSQDPVGDAAADVHAAQVAPLNPRSTVPGPLLRAAESMSASGTRESSRSANSQRYERQKARDWRAFVEYLKALDPPVSSNAFSGSHVLAFLPSLDQFGKTRVHHMTCPFFGSSTCPPRSPCSCPLRQAWGSLDSLLGRLRAAFDDANPAAEVNPFASHEVRRHMRLVKETQARARGLDVEKNKNKKKRKADVAAVDSSEEALRSGVEEVRLPQFVAAQDLCHVATPGSRDLQPTCQRTSISVLPQACVPAWNLLGFELAESKNTTPARICTLQEQLLLMQALQLQSRPLVIPAKKYNR